MIATATKPAVVSFTPITPEEIVRARADTLAFWDRVDPRVAAAYREQNAAQDHLDAAQERFRTAEKAVDTLCRHRRDAHFVYMAS